MGPVHHAVGRYSCTLAGSAIAVASVSCLWVAGCHRALGLGTGVKETHPMIWLSVEFVADTHLKSQTVHVHDVEV